MQILTRLRADAPFDPFARSSVGIRDGCLRLFGQAPVRVIGAGRLPLRFLLLVQLARERWDSDEAIGNPRIDGQSSTLDVEGGGGGGPELVCSWPYFCGPSEWKALQAVTKTADSLAMPTTHDEEKIHVCSAALSECGDGSSSSATITLGVVASATVDTELPTRTARRSKRGGKKNQKGIGGR